MTTGKPLTAKDYKSLAARWITPELATAAQLRRVTSQEAAEQLNRRNSANYAGIWIPYLWPGEATHPRAARIRRDVPDVEVRNGKKRETGKYLNVAGQRNALYFAPATTPEDLLNAEIPLIVTEGEFKTLALARMAQEIGQPAVPVGLSGTANWRGKVGKTTNAAGERIDERGPIPDWDRITLEHRTVYIVFDSDVSTNPNVRYERHRFAEFLSERKARPRYVTLPTKGAKGIDDVLAATPGHAAAVVWGELFCDAPPADALRECYALIEAASGQSSSTIVFDAIGLFAGLTHNQLALAKEAIRRRLKSVSLRDFESSLRAAKIANLSARQTDAQKNREALRWTGQDYSFTPDGIVFWKSLREGGHAATPICNFTAQIISDVTRDDGEEQTRAFEIRATLGNYTRDVIVSAEKFAAMNWPLEEMGARANVYPGYRDHTRSAIQTLSDSIDHKYLYEHTGWTSIDGRPIYLHAAGGISAEGSIPTLGVDLEKIERYELPDPPAGEALKTAIRASLRMLSVHEDRVTIPIYSAIWRAPLAPCPTSLFLAGITGYGKSELAALAQQHYGREWHAKRLPAAWSWTANALEMLSHKAKDVLFVVDDFVPAGAASDAARLHREADRLLRAQGNGSGRGRLNADGKLKSARNPRGIILSTGEDIPHGHSLRGRMVILEMPEPLRWAFVTGCQQDAAEGLYAAALAGYVQYVAPLMADMPARINQRVEEARQAFSDRGHHQRTPDNIAQLAAGMRLFLDYAVSADAITIDEAADLWERAWTAYAQIVDDQTREQLTEEPARLYLDLLRSAIHGGHVHISGPDRKGPTESPEAWGWNGTFPNGSWVGWTTGEDLYLDAQLSYAAVQRLSRDTNTPFLTSGATLGKRLKQKGFLLSVDKARETNHIRRNLLGATVNVWHISPAAVLGSLKNTRQTRQTRQGEPEPAQMSGFGCQVLAENLDDPTNPTTVDSTTYPTKTPEMSDLSGVPHHIEGSHAENFDAVGFGANGQKTRHSKPDKAVKPDKAGAGEVAL